LARRFSALADCGAARNAVAAKTAIRILAFISLPSVVFPPIYHQPLSASCGAERAPTENS